MIILKFKRFGVYLADLPDVPNSSIQKGKRPVIVVSNDKTNRSSGNVTVIPLTTKSKRRMCTHTELPCNCMKNNRRLRYISTALGEQLLPIPKECILEHFGYLKDEYKDSIVNIMKIHLEIIA